MPHRPGIGAIFGITSEDGVAAQKRVVLMDRSNLTVIARTVANADGGYVFSGLDPDSNDYIVLAVDDDGTPRKEAIIHDYIQPIPAYQGATFMGNWEKRAMSGDPLAGFLGLLDQNGRPISIADYEVYFEGTAVTYGLPSITPGAPHLPATQLANCSIASHSRQASDPPSGSSYGYYNNPTRVSLEWVFRRSSLGARQAGVGAFAGANEDYSIWDDSSYTIMIGAMRYNHSTQTLSAWNNTGSSNPGAWGAWRAIINSISLSSYPDVVHIVLTIEYANQAVLYVNGVQAAMASLAGQNSYPWRSTTNGQSIGASLLGDVNDSGNYKSTGRYTTVITGPFVAYDRVLTAQQVLDRYNDLMVGTSPAETGYAKEVVLDHPMYYYRLSEADGSAGFADWLTQAAGNRRALTIYNPAGVAYSQSSPVAGRTAVRFDGAAAARGNRVATASGSRRELTFECFLEPTVQPPTASEIVVANYHDAETIYCGVYRDTNNRLVLRTRESSTDINYTFTTVFPANVRRHVVITLNKGAQRARLYINGALVETLTTTATLMDQWVGRGIYYRETMIAGTVNDAYNGVSIPFRGYVHEVAFYSYELPASRIQAHYDARSVV